MTALFFLRNLGLGAGLAMDACAVSMSDGLNEPRMSVRKRIAIALTFAIFQAVMPIIGFFAWYALIDYISVYIPYVALVLLLFLGGKMIYDGVKDIRRRAHMSDDRTADVANDSETKSVGEPAVPYCESAAVAESAEKSGDGCTRRLNIGTLFLQAVATSIDALSVGLSIANYTISEAFIAAALIAAVTFIICIAAVNIGMRFGDKLGGKAVILGGIILAAIGIEICLTGVL